MAELTKIANDAVKKINSKLECSICLDNFKEPKLLPCFHIFCKSPCLERLVVRDHQGITLTCPTCRHLVPLPDSGVNGLQTDFHIEHLFEIRQALEKAKNTNCENCSDQTATIYCSDCKLFLCDECTETHNGWRKNADHKKVNVKDIKADNVIKITPTKQLLMCDKHTEMEAKIYCETCSDMICNDCTIRLHKDHQYDLAKDVFQKHERDLLEILEQLKTKLATVEKALVIFDAKNQEVTEKRATVEADINREIDQLHHLLDIRRVELLANLDTLAQQKLKKLVTQRDPLETTHVKMNSCLQYAESALKTGTENETLKMKKTLLKRMEQILFEYDPHTIQPLIDSNIQLLTNDIQKACKEFGEITSSLAVSENSYAIGIGIKFAEAGKQTSVEVHPITRHNEPCNEPVMLTAEITHIKTNTTTKCDVQQQNFRHTISYRPTLRGLHTLKIFIDEKHIQGTPHDIVVRPSVESLRKPIRVVSNIKPFGTVYNSKQELLVTTRHPSNAIFVLLEDGTMQKIHSMGPTKPSRIAVDHEDNIYITCYYDNHIIKINPNGDILSKTIKTDIKLKGPVGIAFNKSNHNLYVCDKDNHRILVLTTQLQLVQTFGTKGTKNGQFRDLRNIAFDSSDNLYVTDTGNDRVQVFTADGRFLRAFIGKMHKQKLQSPYAIAIDSSDTVYVSELYQDFINVFTAEGVFLGSFGGHGTRYGLFDGIYGLSIKEDDSVVVSDTNNSRINFF